MVRGTGCGLAVRDQRGEFPGPAVELLGEGRSRARVGEVDGGDPLLRLVERHIGVQDAAGLPVGEDGTQLARAPSQSPILRVFEHLGRHIQTLGVPHPAQFTAASTLLNYILGVGGQNAANARALQPHTTRTEFLNTTATTWAGLDPHEYPFTRNVADQLRDHDDRTEFLAGLDLILTGITTRQNPTDPTPP
ncbi:TetR/AcrR family transcriptional regulator C-terminal domain-containing protein [Streptomyces mirabilis]|uniref:TetR/AcrR family transcriptional regulator C-terminal domain-containing protein n=1 Tax=Streptomyces mirabilis TaxID=68239 RepID=UPI0036AB84A0